MFGIIPRAQHYYYLDPPRLYRSSGSIVFLGDRHRLVLADSDHESFRPVTPNDTSPAAARAALEALMSAAEPAVSGAWIAETSSGTHVAQFREESDAGLAPTGHAWAQPARLVYIKACIAGDEPAVISRRYANTAHLTPREAVIDLLRLACLLEQVSPPARALLARILAGQPLYQVTLAPPRTWRKGTAIADPRSRLRPSVSADSNTIFVWDRSWVDRIVDVIDAGAPSLHRQRRNDRDGDEVVASGAVLGSSELAVADETVRGLPDGVWILPAGGSDLIHRAGCLVTRDEAGWHVALPDDMAGSEELVRRVVLAASGHRLAIEPTGPARLEACLLHCVRATRQLPGCQLRFDSQDDCVAQPWEGIQADRLAVQSYGEAWLGAKTAEVSAQVDEYIAIILSSDLTVAEFEALVPKLQTIGLAALIQRRNGESALALAIAEEELARRRRGERGDVGAFCSALTTHVAASHATSAESRAAIWQRVSGLVREYLTGERSIQLSYTILASDIDSAVPGAWERLYESAPWLLWIAHPSLDPLQGVTVGSGGLIDLLTLLRPRQIPVKGRHGTHYRIDIKPVAARWLGLYRIDAITDLAMIDELAQTTELLLKDPASAAIRAQALALPDEIAQVLDQRMHDLVADMTAPENVLAIRSDGEAPAVVVANLSPRGGLRAQLADSAVKLGPNAITQPGAYNYVHGPVPVDSGDVLAVGSACIDLAGSEPALAQDGSATLPWLPADMFRGREEQLGRIASVIESSGWRAGCLLFGTRRAGKSSLAHRASQHPGLRGSIWLDLSNTRTSVPDHGEWSGEISARLARLARRNLGIAIECASGDLVETLAEMDELLDGGAPAAVVLDELDLLLLPEQGNEGRRTAGRLGNLAVRNLVLIGTVQRFHRSVHEFKTWQSIAVPADLSWSDGVTYFLAPLADLTPGPRVEWLSRAGVTPRLFTTVVEPLIGLRPYFWGQLRTRLDGYLHANPTSSRLIGRDVVRRQLQAVVTEDPHLNSVLDRGEELTAQERRRKDLFSDGERQILASFASMTATGESLSVTKARSLGGTEAVAELVDRAYLAYTPDRFSLVTAVPIYHEFLRSRVTDVLATTAASTPGRERPARRSRARGGGRATSPTAAESTSYVPDYLGVARDAVLTEVTSVGQPVKLSTIANVIRQAAPVVAESGWGYTGSVEAFLNRHVSELVVFPGHGEKVFGTPDMAVLSAGQKMVTGRWSAAQWKAAMEWLSDQIVETDTAIRLTEASKILRKQFPDIPPMRTGKATALSNMVRRYAPRLAIDLDQGGGILHAKGRPVRFIADPDVNPKQWIEAFLWLHGHLAATGEPLSIPVAQKLVREQFPDLPATRPGKSNSFSNMIRQYAPQLSVRGTPSPGMVFDPASISAESAGPLAKLALGGDLSDPAWIEEVWTQAVDVLRHALTDLGCPLRLPDAAALLRRKFPGLPVGRPGKADSFGRMLARFAPDLVVQTVPSPGIVYDPAVAEHASAPGSAASPMQQ